MSRATTTADQDRLARAIGYLHAAVKANSLAANGLRFLVQGDDGKADKLADEMDAGVQRMRGWIAAMDGMGT